jgi:(1->4)-alpha-D-glucan 1-alpha-D-glucosylmutase
MSATPARTPITTYRVQFNRSFTFQDARTVVPYLHALGITDCYASSYLKATPGSLHGYDIADPRTLNPEIGTEEDYRDFARTLREHRMGQILDVVPNHMGISQSCNAWWLDVLENGPSSRYAPFFDIDWHPIKAELNNKILLPILGDLYGAVLENQEIVLLYEPGSFFIRYYGYRLPVSIKSTIRILSHRLDALIQETGATHADVLELQSIITALNHLPPREEDDPARLEERHREKDIVKKRLSRLVQDSPVVAAFLEENVRRFNGAKDDPHSFDLLDGLLNEQVYRLAYWRVAAEEINYRRFFDINELAAIRMENPGVFNEVHQLVFRLLKEGAVTGLRIDHVDGLYDPGEYLNRLQAWAAAELPHAPSSIESGSAGSMASKHPLYVVVEKILGKGETLSEQWPVHGTTGYDFLNLLNGIFIDPDHEHAFTEIYAKFIRQRLSFEDLAYEKKKLIMSVSMASEINTLGHYLNRFSERDRRSRDFTLNSLIHAIREIIACFPVYRTYVGSDSDYVAERDRAFLRLAVMKAKRRNPATNSLVFDFILNILLNRTEDRLRLDREERLGFVMKFQQTTSPVTAKGIEDTALYIYNRLLSLNEVGGEPERFGVSVASFHERMLERQARWPAALSATATHDTKRGEDVRARLNVLSEMPGPWKVHLSRWSRLNKKFKIELDGHPVPDRNEEYLLYQTLVGAWPLEHMNEAQYRTFGERIQTYMDKALREAKVHTSWLNPNQPYDAAMHKFIEAILDRTRPNPFLDDLHLFHDKVSAYGMYNSLSQVLCKMTAPGVPDFYQGTELWDFSLVDPDNRRLVDYDHRIRLLEEVEQALNSAADRPAAVRELLASAADGRIKLFVIMTALRFRRAQASLFLQGAYVPLEVGGDAYKHVCAFSRRLEHRTVLTVVPRLMAGLMADASRPALGTEVWGDTWTALPDGTDVNERYRNLFTGETLALVVRDGHPVLLLAEMLAHCPVALLEKVS